MTTNRNKIKMQGKKPSHRRAIVKSLLIELIRNESLTTTPSKAKVLSLSFDRLVTEAKKSTLASRRNVESRIVNNKTVEKFYNKLLPNLQDRNSGYTKSARTLPRKGDNAEQVIIMVIGTEIKERKSKLEAALNRKEKKQVAEQDKTIAGRIRNTVGGKSGKAKDSTKDTRRNSK